VHVDRIKVLGHRFASYISTSASSTSSVSARVGFWTKQPDAKVALERRYRLVRTARWTSTGEMQKAAPESKLSNRKRVRFEVAGGNYRLVGAAAVEIGHTTASVQALARPRVALSGI
jgi:mRNA-degrading endonuclease HigB of HigAB toxin-antitoxin module